jgi:hypothetical protein
VRYSEVKSVGNVMLPNLMVAPLGDAAGAGFGWDNMMTYKGGVQFQKGKGWTWRAGYSYGKQPIPTSEVLFNILAPGVMEQHATFGFSREVGAGKAFNFSLMRAFSKSDSGQWAVSVGSLPARHPAGCGLPTAAAVECPHSLPVERASVAEAGGRLSAVRWRNPRRGDRRSSPPPARSPP